MIDSIHMKVDGDQLTESHLDYIQSILIGKAIETEGGERSFTGRYKNFRVKVSNRGLSIQGSLTKYVVGDNLKSADKEQLEGGINALNEKFRVNLFSANVTRLDIANNMIMKHPVWEYNRLLVDLNRLNRIVLSNGLVFSNTVRYAQFYDKIKEMKGDPFSVIDEAFTGCNVLRFEFKFLKKSTLSGFLKIKNPTLEDVFNNYNDIVKYWLKIFNDIHKQRDLLELPAKLFAERNWLKKLIMRKGVDSIGGTGVILDIIETAKKRKYLNKKYPNEATNLKRGIKELMSESSPIMAKSDLLEELEEKVALVSFYAQSHDFQFGDLSKAS